MANPVMNQIESHIQKRTPNGYPAMEGYQVSGGQHDWNRATGNAYQSADTGQFDSTGAANGQYATSPFAISTSVSMTFDDVLIKTGIMFAMLLVGAGVAWKMVQMTPGLAGVLILGGTLIGFVLALVNMFKSTPSPVLMLSYATAEGVALGAISVLFEAGYPGIVIQAVIGTFCVFSAALLLYKFNIVRATPGMIRFVFISLVGMIIFGFASMLLSLTGVIQGSLYDVTIMGIPLGVFVGILAVIVGAFSLISDFQVAVDAVEAGLPREFSWRCAFGLMVTLVWLYLEILRLLSYLQRD